MSASSDRQCHLVFTGLENTGQDLQSLRVTAHFGVDAVHKVGKVTSPIQVKRGLLFRQMAVCDGGRELFGSRFREE